VQLAATRRLLRLACGSVLAVMIASGALQLGWGIDLSERLPEFEACLSRWLSGHPCPGCGMLRGLLRLGQLRVADACGLHPLSIPCALGIAWVAAGSPGRGRLELLLAAGMSRAVALAILTVVGVWAVRLVNGSLV
jgi:hypothetical protein